MKNIRETIADLLSMASIMHTDIMQSTTVSNEHETELAKDIIDAINALEDSLSNAESELYRQDKDSNAIQRVVDNAIAIREQNLRTCSTLEVKSK
jgi:uncharacterized protein YjcR